MLQALSRDKRGVTAVEFALLAPLFFAMILSLFETGILLTRIAMVDHAVNVISKRVYTGEVTKGVAAGTISQSDIEDAVCEVTSAVIPNCNSEITVELTEDLMPPGLGLGLKLIKTSSGRFELISSVAFLNEPF